MIEQDTFVFTLIAAPAESLRTLERGVMQRYNWRMMKGGKNDNPRFVIEKQVQHDLIWGWPIYAQYRIVGSFQKNKQGETTLRYGVSGDVGVPLFQAILHMAFLLVPAIILSRFVFDLGGNWLAVLGLMLLLVSAFVYGLFAYRRHQGHLRELHRFMEEFVQHIGGDRAIP